MEDAALVEVVLAVEDAAALVGVEGDCGVTATGWGAAGAAAGCSFTGAAC